jgi:hypothetical protein
MRKTLLVAAVSSLFLGAGTPVRADSLMPGGSVVPSSGSVTGTVLSDTGTMSYSLLAGSKTKGTGTVREVVVSGDSNNPYGGLTFIYQVSGVSTGDIGRITGDGYTLKKTDVIVADAGSSSVTLTYLPGTSHFVSGGTAASTADRSTMPADAGDTVGFNFSSFLNPGNNSELLIIRTNATGYQPGDIALLDSGIASLTGFSPTPEPSTMALLGLQVIGLGAFLVYRRKRQARMAAAM